MRVSAPLKLNFTGTARFEPGSRGGVKRPREWAKEHRHGITLTTLMCDTQDFTDMSAWPPRGNLDYHDEQNQIRHANNTDAFIISTIEIFSHTLNRSAFKSLRLNAFLNGASGTDATISLIWCAYEK